MWTASQTSKILAGNHDVVNIREAKGTLDIIETVFDSQVVPCRFGKVNYQVMSTGIPIIDGPLLYLVPHHSNQELFNSALETAAESADEHENVCMLITHCNYDSPFVKDDVALNMTQRHAKKLLKSFDYIFLGHEHNPRQELGGRLTVVGSPHPTGFGDISDKFVVSIDPDNGNILYYDRVWEKALHYLECDYSELADKLNENHQWVRLTGEIAPSEIHTLASLIRDAWKHFEPFAIRSDVQILTGDINATTFDTSNVDNINEIIERELKNSPDLYKLWRSLHDD
jgi:DNA repair exonuclease SbcCD nuclease subunit